MSPTTLFQINTRVWLRERGGSATATLDDIPDSALDEIAAFPVDWVWFMGVWQTGRIGREISRANPSFRAEYDRLLPGWTDEDVGGSPFAIQRYQVDRSLGGDSALARLRERLRQRGLRLMLDFVPNHTAVDHPWVYHNPEHYIAGSDASLARDPSNYRRVDTRLGPRVLAHGRDPYFPGWPDTLQLNYRHPGLRLAMIGVLTRLSDVCDGVRCDMAMLLLPDVIRSTWGGASQPTDQSTPVERSFWREAITAVRSHRADFVFMAEAYWDLEWELQQQGFDYTYDKRLYDRLRQRETDAVKGHLRAAMDFQERSARFLENHDEDRAASTFSLEHYRTSAVVALMVPGLHLIHDGQPEGRRRRTSNHLLRRAPEPVQQDWLEFHRRLLPTMSHPAIQRGGFHLLDIDKAWEGNPTDSNFIAFDWQAADSWLLAAVNNADTQGQCYLRLARGDLRDHSWEFTDLMSDARYVRAGADLADRGLYLDLPPWRYHVFEVTPTPEP